MCQGSTYIKGMSLGFLANWFLMKNLSLSLASPCLLSFLFFSSMPKSGASPFSTHQEVLLCLQEWRSRRRRRRLLIKELIPQSRSRCWSRCSRLKFFLRRRVFYEKKLVRDWSRWIPVEVGHIYGSSIYESVIIRSGEYLPAPR